MAEEPNKSVNGQATEQSLVLVLQGLHEVLKKLAESVKINEDNEDERIRVSNKLLLYKAISISLAIIFGIPGVIFFIYVMFSLFTKNG